MKKLYIIVLILTILWQKNAPAEQPVDQPGIGIDEKLGGYVPLDLTFNDENGKAVSLKQFIKKPTIVSLVYYRCPGICTPLLSGVAEVLNKLQLEPDKDYSVLTISFDDKDTPSTALQKKKNYLKLLKKPFPEDGWRFLTGDTANISKLTSAVGFKFEKDGDDFIHPASLIVLSADGKIVRYLYGITYLPFDLQMALTEASEGRAGPTISKALLFCFSYDPKGRKYALNVTRVAGASTLFLTAIFVVYLTLRSKTRIRKTR